MTESRKKRSAKNVFFAALNMIVQLLLKFAVRIIFVRFLSVEYLGLNTLFANILGLLSLAELGVGSAIVYSMYKPIADGDTEKIKALVGVYKKFYWIVGAVITVIGLALIPALPYLMNGGTTLDVNLNIVYVIYLFNTSVGYFFAHRRAIIFANQRNDIETKVASISMIGLNAVQLAVLAITKNYLAYISVMPVSTLIESGVIAFVSHKLYPELNGKAMPLEKDDKKALLKNTTAMIWHKVGGAAVNSTDNIFISAFVGLNILGLYSNYALIITTLSSIITLITTATRASIGNLIASDNKEHTFEVFSDLNYLLFVVIIFCFSCYTALSQDFIGIVFGKELILPFWIMFVIGVNFYIMQSRAIVLAFRDASGMFWKDRYKPLFESVLNLGLDFLLVIYMGLPGVILATVISNLVCNITIEPYVLYKYYFEKKVSKFYIVYVLTAIAAAGVCAVTYFLCSLIPIHNIWWFVLKMFAAVTVSGVLLLVLSLPLKQFKNWKSIIASVFRKNKKTEE